MVDVKQAVASARKFATDTLGVDDLLLEEISSDERSFDITLSFPKRSAGPGYTGLAAYREREFKRFEVDKSTGEVSGMHIRQLG